MACASLAKELESLSMLLITRNNVSGDTEKTKKLCNSLVASFCKKILNATLQTEEVASLMLLLEETKLPGAFKTMIQVALHNLLEGHAATDCQVVQQQGANGQNLGLGIVNYWTKPQLEKWADPEVDFDDKKLMVLELFFKLGMVFLAEDSIRWAIAFQLYWLYKTKREWPTYHCIYYDWVLGNEA